MATFGFKDAFVATYAESGKTKSYTGCVSMGNPIDCTLDLKTAEGRLFAGDALTKHRRKITGGTVAVSVEDIPQDVRSLMFGEEKSVTTISGGSTPTVNGLKITDSTLAPYVGFAAYAPDDVEGKDKFTAVFVAKTLFSSPGFKFQTMDESIAFQTPHTVGEFMKAADGVILEFATLDKEADAIAWCKACLGGGK